MFIIFMLPSCADFHLKSISKQHVRRLQFCLRDAGLGFGIFRQHHEMYSIWTIIVIDD